MPTNESQVVIVAIASGLFAAIHREDVMLGLWSLYTAMLGLSLIRDWRASRCRDALEALTARAERAVDTGSRVSWFADELARHDPAKAERVRRRRRERGDAGHL